MAIYHLSVKAISRSAGRSATAAAAYRSGCVIEDERTGERHDYSRKRGVESADLVLPLDGPAWASDRARLWNAAELAEKRKDSCVAREFEVALPAELSPSQRRRLAVDFAQDMANREGCAVDVAIHAPGRGGDNRNHHAHILRTTRKVAATGLGAKLDTEKAGRNRVADLEAVRARWAQMTNERLRDHGIEAQVDHRSLEAQGIEREPTRHLGPAASGYERRTGQPSDKRLQQEREAGERLLRAKEAGELERQSHQVERSILDLSGDLRAAKAQRDRAPTPEAIEAGLANVRAQFQLHQHEREKVERERAERARIVRAQQDKGDQAQAERQRIERMSAAELRAEVVRLRPPPPSRELVERQPDLMAARQDKDRLAEHCQQAQAMAVQAERELENWRRAHPVRAKAHDAGLLRSSVVLETELRRDQAQTQRERLAAGLEAATQHLQRTRSRTETRLTQEQEAPVLAQLSELERLERHQEAREQAERAKVQVLDKAMSAFKGHALKREMKAHSYGDTGRQWNAIPGPLRKVIEDFNRLSKEARAVVLERMRDNMKRDSQSLERLTQQLDQVREHDRDRGMSR